MKKLSILCYFIVLLGFTQCKNAAEEQNDVENSKEKKENVVETNKEIEVIDFKAMKYQGTTRNIHAIKTQYYRWYQLYERDFTPSRIQNQLSILSDDVVITTAAGAHKGKEGYPDLLKVYKGWKNAHHVQSSEVMAYPDGTLRLKAKIIYQNRTPEGKKSEVNIAYDIYALQENGELPKLNSITITPVKQLEVTEFQDSYPTNRVLALMHYWLYNVEAMDGNSEPFKALLANDFKLHFSEGNTITNLEQFDAWIKGAASQVNGTNHFPENAIIKKIGDDLYELQVDFIWRGTTKDGVNLKAHTFHTWIVEDDINEPFARIKEMKVAYKVPFSPLEQ